jgi:hypothetical protein
MRKIPHLIIAGYLFYMIKNKKEVDRNMEGGYSGKTGFTI